MTIIRANCGHCGTVRLQPDDVFVLMSSRTAMFEHCDTTQETPPIRDPFYLLALAVAGCMQADARDVEAALAQMPERANPSRAIDWRRFVEFTDDLGSALDKLTIDEWRDAE